MSIIPDWLQEWARKELADMTRVPATLVLVAVLAFAGGWVAARFIYSERMALMELQRDAAMEVARAQVGKPVTVVTSAPWRTKTFWIVAGVLLVGCATFAVLNSRARRDMRGLVKQIDRLQDSAHDASKERARLVEERDAARVALKDRIEKNAMEVLEAYSKLRPVDSSVQTTVTVRYASYNQDYELAQQLKGLVTQYVKWPVTLDASNKPALPRADKFKVVFDVGKTYSSYARLMHAISELLDVKVGRIDWVERDDSHHVIVMVLPSDGAETVRAEPV